MASIEDFIDAGLEAEEPMPFSDEAEGSSSTEQDLAVAGAQDSTKEGYEIDPTTNVFEAGMKCESKRLYPKGDKSRHIEWVDEIPTKIMDGHRDTWNEYALLLCTNLDQGEQRLHFIVIQSPLLKSKLNSIFTDYPGFFIGRDKSSIEAPFKPFIHCWDVFIEACDGKSETAKHMQLLRSALEPEFQRSLSVMEEFQAHGMIRFDQLWIIFKPGCFVFTEQSGVERIYKLARTEVRKSHEVTGTIFLLHCHYIDWDGKMHGQALRGEMIEDFEGSKKYNELGIYPLGAHPAKAAIVKRLVERGRKFSSYTGVHYQAYEGLAMAYDGRAKGLEWDGRPVNEYVSGRVVIDTETFLHFNPYHCNKIQRLGTKEPKGEDFGEDSDDDFNRPRRVGFRRNGDVDGVRLAEQAMFRANKNSSKMEQAALTEDELMICCSTVRGYSLALNRWMEFRVESLRDIEWSANAFDSLALPGNYKELLLAFARTQRNATAQFDDVIEGKGQGMVVLLEGPPGLGKTLTVESLAEEMKAPIYRIEAGQMRSDSACISRVLQNAFQMIKAWKGIILLDEADVFLERRSVNDLERNQLVSVFLQHLEYFEGTIFLTTNRVECIDPAFESRIQLSLTYPPLTQELRHKIWENFIRMMTVDTSQITDAHLDKLASVDMNGRQIRNAVKMAGLLAAKDNHCLTAQHVATILSIVQSK